MNSKFYLIIFATLISLAGCSRNGVEYDFNQPVFINDADNHGLPVYSDMGYNTFGTYYNSKVLISSKIRNENMHTVGSWKDSLTISFRNLSDTSGHVEATLLITKKNIQKLTELSILKGQSFNLTSDSAKMKINENVIKISSGYFNFNTSRQLIVDGNLLGIILSGSFEVEGTMNNNSVQMRKGRFDILVQTFIPNLFPGNW